MCSTISSHLEGDAEMQDLQPEAIIAGSDTNSAWRSTAKKSLPEATTEVSGGDPYAHTGPTASSTLKRGMPGESDDELAAKSPRSATWDPSTGESLFGGKFHPLPRLELARISQVPAATPTGREAASVTQSRMSIQTMLDSDDDLENRRKAWSF